jgi:MerR family transcriptional regulator, heat shock protein HspR
MQDHVGHCPLARTPVTKPGRAERSTGRPKTSADVDDGPRHSSSRGEPAPTNRRPSQRVAADASPTVDMARGVYAISVVAELVGIDQQSLRLYERRGLLQPVRTEGGTRRYSSHDIDRLHRILQLLRAGLNLAGIALVLDLEADNAHLRARLDERHSE